MREILFRAKRIDNGEWAEGYFVTGKWYFDEKERYAILPTDICFYPYCEISEWIEIDPETLCQYTGMKDKNGNRIWENDIVCFTDMTSTDSGYCEHNCMGQVVWNDEEACFCVTDRLSSESWEVLQDCYIVGNIFDNPELLKGE